MELELTQEQVNTLGTIILIALAGAINQGRLGEFAGLDENAVVDIAQERLVAILSVVVAGEPGTRQWNPDKQLIDEMARGLGKEGGVA